MSGQELRRRAQPLLDRAPYAPLRLDELRDRARRRRRSSQRAIAALTAVAIIGVGVGAIVANNGSGSGGVEIRTTTPPAPSSTVPASTTIADLHLTPIAGPDGTTPVETFAAGDHFLAVPQASDVTRLWEGDARGRWTRIPVPHALLHHQLDSLQRVGDGYYVLGSTRTSFIVFEGADLAHLRASGWELDAQHLPHAMRIPPPSGRGLVVSGSVGTVGVTDAGLVAIGQVGYGFDRRLLPSSVRDQLAHRPGRIDVKDGRVTVTISPNPKPVYDRSTRSLGIRDDVASWLEGADASGETAVWTAAPGEPVRQVRLAHGIAATQLFNPEFSPVGGGLLMKSDAATTSDLWWTRDGRSWRRLATPPREAPMVIDVGARWVAPTAGVESDDEGRSWVPIRLGPLPAHQNAPASFGAQGTPGFGILGSATPIDASTVTTYASRLYYSPDGVQWTSVTLNQELQFDANIPTIVVGDRAAIIESGLHRIGPQPQRFWLVTLPG